MTEHISKEQALIALEIIASDYSDRGLTSAEQVAKHCADTIGRLPPADVRPVVRGRWVKAGGSFVTPGGDPVWECSECGKGKHVYGIEHGTYGADVSDGQWVACPNCGARMDG